MNRDQVSGMFTSPVEPRLYIVYFSNLSKKKSIGFSGEVGRGGAVDVVEFKGHQNGIQLLNIAAAGSWSQGVQVLHCNYYVVLVEIAFCDLESDISTPFQNRQYYDIYLSAEL